MTELERIDKVINDLYSIRDVALSVFGDEGYFALDDSIRSLTKTWNICKRGQEEKLKNAYHTPVNNSKKSIESSLRKEDMNLYLQYRDDLFHAINEVDKKYNMSGRGPLATKEDFDEVVEWMDVHDYWAEPEEEEIESSRKPIKSSLDDEIIPYLEEFEEGYADAITRDLEEAGELNHVYQDTFFEQFKSDHNLTDTDIHKLDKAVRGIWDASSTEEGEIRDMGEMYGVPRGATSEEALKVFQSKKPIKSGSMSGWFGGICDKCKQYTNVRYVGYNGRKLCARCSRGR